MHLENVKFNVKYTAQQLREIAKQNEGINGKNYIYFKDDEVCRVAYNKKEKSVNLNFGNGTGTDFEFDPKEESFEEFIKNIVYTINDQKPSK